MAAVDEIRHDTASLYRFINSVCASCDSREAGRTYPPASDDLLAYIRELGDCTRLFLETFPATVPLDSSYNFYRQKLLTLRSCWFELHQYIKPTADAHTLSLPGPLIEGLLRRFRQLPGFADSRFAVFHIEKLNYLQVVASGVRAIAGQMASIIPNAPSFPSNLGLLGIPYSQGSSVFLNCLIPHEMAHFAYGENGAIRAALLPRLASSLTRAFAGLPPLDPQNIALLMDWLESWTEEVFCDLFAIWLVGPCYSFAFIEIFDLTNILDSAGGLNSFGTSPYSEFFPSHPSSLFRIKQHLALLERLDWWPQFNRTKSHYYKVLELSNSLVDGHFAFSKGQNMGTKALEAFFDVVPAIHEQVNLLMSSLDTGLAEYKVSHHAVQEYLKNGVVPSTIPSIEHSTKVFPSPVTVLNAAYSLYLESLDTLISGIANQDPSSIRDRQKWAEKLESWASKAIEDHGLLISQKAG